MMPPRVSGRAAGSGLRKDGIESVPALGPAELLTDRTIAEQPGHARECLQMIGPRLFRRQQYADQVHRLIIDRVKVDWRLQTRKKSVETFQSRQLAVGYGDAVANPGRTQSLPLHQHLEDGAIRQP